MSEDTLVYVKDPELAWVPATLVKTEGDKAVVAVQLYDDPQKMGMQPPSKKTEERTVLLKDYPHKVLPLQNADKNHVVGDYPDMVELPYLHEAGILFALKRRHQEGKPYTRTGDIIIAVNPFQWFNDLYTEKKRAYYSNRVVWDESDKDPREGMEPHVYEVSALAYKGLAFGGRDQSILVSGESGAGKTETVKICMNHMASVQQGPSKGGSDELDPVVKKVVQSNPLLEAFGNAKTRRNDNSSRFGKYLQLQFDNSEAALMALGNKTESKCKLAGSKCDVYLLEKNRVTIHDEEERTYHIFYQILCAPDDQKANIWPLIKGKGWKDFKYVQDTKTTKIEGKTDAEHFETTVETLNLIGVKDAKLKEMLQAICMVMQCGNLTFGPLGGDKDKSEITSAAAMKDLAELMGVSTADLSQAFTVRTVKTKTETYQVPLNVAFAKDAADAMAREIYGNVFLWLVKAINIATRAEENYKGGSMEKFNYGIVGMLDIFGFESFAVNRFEQLCINYANEKLQQKFTEDIFRSVQDEYEQEGIELAEIWYDDNTDVLDLIEGRGGLLALLNEECVRPKGNDQDFVQKALTQNKNSPCLIVNKMDRMSFGIHHYAGKVMYDAEGFVTSNQDTLPTDLSDLCEKVANSIVSTPIKDEESNVERAAPKRQKSNLVAPTVWGKYKTQLASLMGNLRKTNSRYIRCIKPNMAKKPVLMDQLPTVEQLRCAGVVAAVTLSRSAFPNRLDNNVVKYRYASMWDPTAFPTKKNNQMTAEEGLRADCTAILTCALKPKELNDDGKVIRAFVVGKTRSYFRAGALEYLEANRLENGLDAPAIKIQKLARGFIIRKNWAEIRKQYDSVAKRKQEEEDRKKEEARKMAELERIRKEGEAQRKAQEEKLKKEKQEREERERREALEKARKEKDLLEQRQREEEEYQEGVRKLKKKVKKYENEIEEKKENARVKVKEVEDQIDRLEVERADLEKKHKEMMRIASETPQDGLEADKKKLEESEKIVDYLKKENKKVREQTEKMREELQEMKEQNNRLVEANASAGASLDSLEKQKKNLAEHNVKLEDNLKKWQGQNEQLKRDLSNRKSYFKAETEIRAKYEKALEKIIEILEERCDDPDLVEEVTSAQIQCEELAQHKGVGSIAVDD